MVEVDYKLFFVIYLSSTKYNCVQEIITVSNIIPSPRPGAEMENDGAYKSSYESCHRPTSTNGI